MVNLTGLPAGSWVVVTGANGYIGSHVVNTLLQLGYRVRGTIRTPKPWLDAFFETKYGQGVFESYVLPDFDDKEKLDKCLDGISGIVHVVRFYFKQSKHLFLQFQVQLMRYQTRLPMSRSTMTPIPSFHGLCELSKMSWRLPPDSLLSRDLS